MVLVVVSVFRRWNQGLVSAVLLLISLEKKLIYSTLSLSTQVYKWLLATKCWGGGGNLMMD